MRLNVVLAGVLLIFLVGTAVTTVLPLTDIDLITPSARAKVPSNLESQGRAIYLQEGCWYCHSQYVRPVVADQNMNLGPVSVAGDYFYRQPATLGSERTGPDIMWVGDRLPAAAWHIQHLKDPRSVSPGSIMPSYSYLSDQQIEAVTAYLLSLNSKPSMLAVATVTEGGTVATPPPPPATVLLSDEELAQGDATRGEGVFASQACAACHQVTGTAAPVCPNLSAIGTQAATIIEEAGYAGQATSGSQYLYESIVNPGAFIVSGFADGVMPNNFMTTLSQEQIVDIVAYLNTLKGG
jgi:cbb3-type cytochrome oxidase cytochrome c subunit/cytochrome c553